MDCPNLHIDTTIYRMVMEETRWGAVSPGSGWLISTFRADFVSFTSKFVRISPNLLPLLRCQLLAALRERSRLMFFQLHPSEASRQGSGHGDHENAIEDQGQAHYPGNALSWWEHFFCEDQNGKYCHHCDIHNA